MKFPNNYIPILETEDLILRALTIKDSKDIKEWINNRYLFKYWGDIPRITDLHPELMFKKNNIRLRNNNFHWGIEYKSNNKIIGEIWICFIGNKNFAKVAYRLSSKYQNKGIMTQALQKVVTFCFSSTKIKKIFATVHIKNIPSIKLLEKCLFKRNKLIKNGLMNRQKCNFYVYSISK